MVDSHERLHVQPRAWISNQPHRMLNATIPSHIHLHKAGDVVERVPVLDVYADEPPRSCFAPRRRRNFVRMHRVADQRCAAAAAPNDRRKGRNRELHSSDGRRLSPIRRKLVKSGKVHLIDPLAIGLPQQRATNRSLQVALRDFPVLAIDDHVSIRVDGLTPLVGEHWLEVEEVRIADDHELENRDEGNVVGQAWDELAAALAVHRARDGDEEVRVVPAVAMLGGKLVGRHGSFRPNRPRPSGVGAQGLYGSVGSRAVARVRDGGAEHEAGRPHHQCPDHSQGRQGDRGEAHQALEQLEDAATVDPVLGPLPEAAAPEQLRDGEHQQREGQAEEKHHDGEGRQQEADEGRVYIAAGDPIRNRKIRRERLLPRGIGWSSAHDDQSLPSPFQTCSNAVVWLDSVLMIGS
mmetsp:Transcript_12818/g.47397  ORF Transcript_12818/g.47397 Transcript_12818/m.47397 type:complete len:407 (+) Transcript_12818:180-1400(+)